MVGQSDEGRLVAGRYRLLERIGRGGMGTVWRAEDELLGRQVAVKKLHPPQPHFSDDELATLFERTRREARAAARISHPNVVVVHDVVDDAGLPSIVMEYVPSQTLGERLKQDGALPVAEVARIGRGMVAALRAAHRAGVLHRDVKPGNVLLGLGGSAADGEAEGRVVLTDFGIAQASGTSTLTRTGELIGSIDFLSPERIRGALPGPESDLWALGATLYQAVEGASPFRRPTAIETAYSIAEDPVLPPPNGGVLSRVITGLLAKDPAERLSAEEAERLLRIPAAEPDTALVGEVQVVSQRTSPEDSGTAVVRRPAYSAQAPAEARPAGSRPGQGLPVPVRHDTDPPYPVHVGPAHASPVPVNPAHASPVPAHPAHVMPAEAHSALHVRPAEAGRRRRTGPWIAAVVAIALVAGGSAFAAVHLASGSGSGTEATPSVPVTTAPTATTAPPTPSLSVAPPVPAGYHLYTEPSHGYSVPVPDGWTEQVKSGGDEVDFIDPTGLVGLKVSALDFASTSPYAHFQNLEPQTEEQVDGYHRERLDPTTAFGEPAAIWEFTFQGSVREYRARDLGFGKPGGTEYAIYLSAPDEQWLDYRPVFDNATAGFRLSAP